MTRFALLLALTACLAGQSKRKHIPAEPAPAPKVHEVDVLVADSAGSPTPDLTAADFDLTAGGTPVPVAGARYVSGGPRTVVLVVDDAGISLDAVARVRNALLEFVNQQMRPDDQAAILRTRSGSGDLETITADKRLLAASVSEIQFDPSHPVAGPARDEFILTGMVTTLRSALVGLAALPGRKAVVFISENLALMGQHPERFNAFALRSADASAVFYTLDLGGSQRALLILPGETGGLDLGAELAPSLARVLRDQENYYLLSYSSEAGTLAVKLRKPALHARSRTSPLRGGETEANFRLRTTPEEQTAAIRSPFIGGSIHMQVSPIFGDTGATGLAVTALVWVDGGAFTFLHQLNGTHQAGAQLVVSAFGGNGLNAAQTEGRITLVLTGEQYQRLLKDGWMGQMQLRLRTPGVYQVRASVLNDNSSRAGTASQLLEVPDVSAGQMALSSIALRGKAIADLPATVGRRTFTPGETVSFVYQILNPYPDPAKPPQLESVISLYRGNQQIFKGEPQILVDKKLDDPKLRPVAGELSLGAKLPAGRYSLLVTVADPHSEKPRQAQQWIDFQVRP